jgi:hypothetical protein
MTPFEAFKMYIAVKQHFSVSSYDYFKYNGKSRVSQNTFDTRKDKYSFYKLSKQENVLDFLVANLYETPNMWVGELFSEEGNRRYMDYKKRRESLTYTFQNDIDLLLDNFDENFKVVDGGYPHLLKLLTRKKISIETFIIINECVKFFNTWNKQIMDPILWPTISMRCKKFVPFMEYDKDKYCHMLRDKFSQS